MTFAIISAVPDVVAIGTLRRMLIAKKIDVPFTREALATWKPVPLTKAAP